MNEPLVTVVLPVYNSSRYLKECVESVINQSFTDWQLIAVDDGSTDNSVEVLRQFSDDRIEVLENQTNFGPAYTRNLIIRTSVSKYIALQDSDDFMHPNRLAEQVAFLEANSGIALVGTFMNLIAADGSLYLTSSNTRESFTTLGLLFRNQAPPHATLMGRRNWFLRNPYPEEIRRGEDKYMIVNAVNNSDFAYSVIPRALYVYRHQSSHDPHKLLTAYRTERSHLAKFIPNLLTKFLYVLFSTAKSVRISLITRFLKCKI